MAIDRRPAIEAEDWANRRQPAEAAEADGSSRRPLQPERALCANDLAPNSSGQMALRRADRAIAKGLSLQRCTAGTVMAHQSSPRNRATTSATRVVSGRLLTAVVTDAVGGANGLRHIECP